MANVLVVDDNIIYRSLLREICELERHTVREASNAEEVLELLRRNGRALKGPQRPDLILLDFNMGEMNGFELISQLRQHDELSQVPILMITSTTKDIAELLKMQGVAYLPKPTPNTTILMAIRKLLGVGDTQLGSGEMLPEPPPAYLVQDRPLEFDPPLPRSAYFPPEDMPPGRDPGLVFEPPLPREAPPPPPPPPAGKAGASGQKRGKPSAGGRSRDASGAHKALAPQSKKERSAPPPREPVQKPLPPDASLLRPPAPPPPPARGRGAVPEDGETPGSQELEAWNEAVRAQEQAGQPSAEEGSAVEGGTPVADLLDRILDDALVQKASDIHMQPQADGMAVRVRVDGALRALTRLPASIVDNVTARVKIVAQLNITEKRFPQDGQFSRVGPDGQAVKFRVSTLPALGGEKIVLRILPTGKRSLSLDAAGFSPAQRQTIGRALRCANGLILATGPTGSGKTTTLYTMLETLNTPDRNIVTVEDPVEYQLPGITQVQVNHAIGYTFEKVLRSFLRQDPNVMLVGEIRDAETADIALKASVTGHLVLSTLHTNDAVGAVHRLMSMGLPAHLVAAASRLIISQRLVRVLCPRCRVEDALNEEESCMLTDEERAALPRVWRPKGCPACRGAGYAGRLVICEMLPVSSHEMRKAIAAGASPGDLLELAAGEGMVPIRQEALRCVAEGRTSLAEALAAILF